MYVELVNITNYSQWKSYYYNCTTGAWTSIVIVDGSVGAKANSSPAGTTATASSGVASVSGTAAAAMAAESAVSGGVGIMVRSEIGAVVAVALVVQLVEPLHVLI
jgi:hypothetical protein